MRKAVAVLGVAMLGVAGGNAPAVATTDSYPPGALICHLTEAGTYEPFYVSVHGMIHNLNGHGSHSLDIIPFPGFGGNPAGQNMTPENVAIFNNGCVGAVVTPAGPAAPNTPAAPVTVPMPVPAQVPAAVNRGYNVDGAVPAQPAHGASNDVMPIWLGAAGALLAAAGLRTFWSAKVRTKNVAG